MTSATETWKVPHNVGKHGLNLDYWFRSRNFKFESPFLCFVAPHYYQFAVEKMFDLSRLPFQEDIE